MEISNWYTTFLVFFLSLLSRISHSVLSVPHPLDPLSPAEIKESSRIIQSHFGNKEILAFSTITLKEPKKSEVTPYFLNENDISSSPSIPRISYANVIDYSAKNAYKVVVNLSNSTVESVELLDPNAVVMFAEEDESDLAKIVLKDPRVQAKLLSLGLKNASSVVPLLWDMVLPDKEDEKYAKISKLVQIYFALKLHPADNFYTHPLPFLAIMDYHSLELIHLQDIPFTKEFESPPSNDEAVFPFPLPLAINSFDPILRPSAHYRAEPHPIKISQDGGSNIVSSGKEILWQNFKMRWGFNSREGLVLYHIKYSDRPLIYRASVSEVFVPYNDPRPPLHDKQAFDATVYGLGLSAHPLFYPADCKNPNSKFFDVTVANKLGQPRTIPRAICVFEEDHGVLSRKYFHGSKRNFIIRDLRLVLTFAAALGNYDYQFRWIFGLDASIRMEVQLDGVVHMNYMAPLPNPQEYKFGTVVAPLLNALNHQHIFAFRLDCDLDGLQNSVAVQDLVASGPTGSKENPFGNGWYLNRTFLRTQSEGRSNSNLETSRTWGIFGNLSNSHPQTGKPRGYKLVNESPFKLSIQRDSPLYPRCGFAEHQLWVTRYQDGQLDAGGEYLNGSGIPEWISREPSLKILEEDIVLWPVIGVTHIPRAEDFPVMSREIVSLKLSPINFFVENPSLDVPPIMNTE